MASVIPWNSIACSVVSCHLVDSPWNSIQPSVVSFHLVAVLGNQTQECGRTPIRNWRVLFSCRTDKRMPDAPLALRHNSRVGSCYRVGEGSKRMVITFRRSNKEWTVRKKTRKILPFWPNEASTTAEDADAYCLVLFSGNCRNLAADISRYLQSVRSCFVHFVFYTVPPPLAPSTQCKKVTNC